MASWLPLNHWPNNCASTAVVQLFCINFIAVESVDDFLFSVLLCNTYVRMFSQCFLTTYRMRGTFGGH